MSILPVLILLAAVAAIPLAAVGAFMFYAFARLGRLASFHEARPVLAAAAETLGLVRGRRSLILGDIVYGAVRGHRVMITQRYQARAEDSAGTYVALRIEITAKRPIPERLTLGPKTETDGSPSRALSFPLRTADQTFDRHYLVAGRASGVAAHLDASLRTRLVNLAPKVAISLHQTSLVAVTRAPLFLPRSIELLVEELTTFLDDLLAEGPEIPARLLANGISDPQAAVRYQNLDLLLREHATTEQAKAALAMAWNAPERGIRYLAAIRMNSDEAVQFLFETAEAEEEPVALRTMVLRHLARHAPAERVLPLLRAQLAADHPALQTTAIELLGRMQDKATVTELVRLGRTKIRASTKAVIARALGVIGDPSAEDFIVELLHDDDLELKLAAVIALGRIGSPRVLSILGRMASRYAGIRELSEAASSSAAQIEARVGPVERGRLSVIDAGGPTGALSLAEGAGTLAIAPEASSPSETTKRAPRDAVENRGP